jgi:hypothetical protein
VIVPFEQSALSPDEDQSFARPPPAIRCFRVGHWLALATALLLIVGAVAKATGTSCPITLSASSS